MTVEAPGAEPLMHLTTLDQWRTFATEVRAAGRTVGLVPTMGALHQGHAALIAAAQANGDVALVTIFVNPLQFTNPDDLERYPRPLSADLELAGRCGAAAVVSPSLADMWPDGPATLTTVHVADLGDQFEGVDRPGHFAGVATVVTKLFALTGPCRAYFGEKDFQQLTIVRRLVRDLGLPVTVEGVPTVRTPEGLALSSRNVRLTPTGRERARALSVAGRRAQARAGEAVVSTLVADVTATLHAAALDVAYVAIVDPTTLAPCDDHTTGPARLLLAVVVDGVRLLDEFPLTLGGSHVVGD